MMIDLQTAISFAPVKDLEKLYQVSKKLPKGLCEMIHVKRCDICVIANYCYENLRDNILGYRRADFDPLAIDMEQFTPESGKCRYHPIQSVKSRKHLIPDGKVVCFGDKR